MALAVFVVYERRRESRGLPVLLDTDLFRIHAFRIGNAVAALWVVSGAGVVLLLPPLMHLALGYGAIEVGLMVSPLALGADVESGQRRGHRLPPGRCFGHGGGERLGANCTVPGALKEANASAEL